MLRFWGIYKVIIISLIPSFSFCWPLLQKMIKLNSKVYDLINWQRKNLKTHIVWILEKNIASDIFNCYLGRREKYLSFWSTDRVNLFFNLARPGSKFCRERFFPSSLRTSIGVPATSFIKKWAIYNKKITLNLEHTFFLREIFIYNDVSDHFSLSNAIN